VTVAIEPIAATRRIAICAAYGRTYDRIRQRFRSGWLPGDRATPALRSLSGCTP
jgi:hypothetical protein